MKDKIEKECERKVHHTADEGQNRLRVSKRKYHHTADEGQNRIRNEGNVLHTAHEGQNRKKMSSKVFISDKCEQNTFPIV